MQDYTEFSSTGATFELGTPIDAIASVVSFLEFEFFFVYKVQGAHNGICVI